MEFVRETLPSFKYLLKYSNPILCGFIDKTKFSPRFTNELFGRNSESFFDTRVDVEVAVLPIVANNNKLVAE
jgi:hypothetical protein